MNESGNVSQQHELIAALTVSLKDRHGTVELFETHISWVLVAGEFAYKFKKAVRFDFLDFSTLDARRRYCEEELRLNRRLAPDMYLDVLAVGGSKCLPSLAGTGEPIEYCVRMRAFAQEALWTHRLAHKLLSGEEVDMLAGEVACFHLAAAAAPAGTPWGEPALLRRIAQDNHAQIAGVARGQAAQWESDVRRWTSEQQDSLEPVFAERKRRGRVRECHGDLHSGNILTVDGKVMAFDCIEFNDSLRWIDVINDIAFVCMDLQFQGRRDLAARCLNRYLEAGGDYEGARVLRYYVVQRALVRSKVAFLRMRQPGIAPGEASAHEREGLSYLAFAAKGIKSGPVALMITHGFSGSGKSVLARQVVECMGALQLRSDVERKRQHGASDPELYSSQATQRTYRRLLALARMLAGAGMPVVVDAAFLKQAQRREFASLAGELGVPFFIFDLRASEATMRARVRLRAQSGLDASDAGVDVLEKQLRNHEPLSAEEAVHAITIDSEAGVTPETVQALCKRDIEPHIAQSDRPAGLAHFHRQ